MPTTTAGDTDRLIAEFQTLYEWASDLANSVRYGSKITHKLGKVRHDRDVAYRLLAHLRESPWVLGPALDGIEKMLVKVDAAIVKATEELADLNRPVALADARETSG